MRGDFLHFLQFMNWAQAQMFWFTVQGFTGSHSFVPEASPDQQCHWPRHDHCCTFLLKSLDCWHTVSQPHLVCPACLGWFWMPATLGLWTRTSRVFLEWNSDKTICSIACVINSCTAASFFATLFPVLACPFHRLVLCSWIKEIRVTSWTVGYLVWLDLYLCSGVIWDFPLWFLDYQMSKPLVCPLQHILDTSCWSPSYQSGVGDLSCFIDPE